MTAPRRLPPPPPVPAEARSLVVTVPPPSRLLAELDAVRKGLRAYDGPEWPCPHCGDPECPDPDCEPGAFEMF